MAYQRKTADEWQVQVDYGHGDGFEAVAYCGKRKEALQAARDYRVNDPLYPVRIVCKRVACPVSA